MPGRRGRVGVKAALEKKRRAEAAAKVGSQLEAEDLKHVEQQMTMFKSRLEEFARKYKNDIIKDPEFRHEFYRMTASVGVDPLASSKGFWGEILGAGDFYYELSVQIADACLATRAVNGGLIAMSELLGRVRAMRGSAANKVSQEDLMRAIKKLSVLGSGYKVVQVGSAKMVVSVPYELNRDHSVVIGEAAATGYVTKSSLKASLGWPDDRLSRAMTGLLREGMAWIDDQCDGERQYWFPSVMGGLEEDEDGDDEDDDTVGAGGGAGAGAGASAV